ncbi:MAG: peptidylprolyl isomerase [Anaerolineales bacterium]
MPKYTLLLIIIVWGTLLLGGCESAPSISNPTVPSPETARGVEATPESTTTLEKDDMPTAIPLDTSTPTTPLPITSTTQSEAMSPSMTTPEETLPSSAVAVVNDTIIPKAEFESQYTQAEINFSKRPGFEANSDEGRKSLQRLKEQVLDWLIDQVLIKKAAKEWGITVSQEQIDEQITRMAGQDEERFQQWLSANGLTMETLRGQIRMDLITAAVRDNVTDNLSREVPQVRVRHILLSEESQAQKILQELQKGANFVATTRQYSEDESTRENGGDLGFLPRGVMPPAFEEEAFSLEPGQTSDIIRTGSGLHIIQVVEKDPQRRVPDRFWLTVQQRAFEDWLAQQRADATIQRNLFHE